MRDIGRHSRVCAKCGMLLTRVPRGRIVDKHVRDVNHRLEDRSIVLKCTTSALDLIAENGYDPVYGARPLQRAVRRDIETPLAKELLSGRLWALLPPRFLQAAGPETFELKFKTRGTLYIIFRMEPNP